VSLLIRDFDRSDDDLEWLFRILRSRWYLWDFDSMCAVMPPHLPSIAFLYEYSRSSRGFLEGYPGRGELITKMGQDIPEWPKAPYIFADPEHVFNFGYRGWPPSPLVYLTFDPKLSKRDALKLCGEQWKAQQIQRRSRRGSGAPDRAAKAYLRWLGHSRLFAAIKTISSGWKATDHNRFEQLYLPFLLQEGAFAYGNLSKLQVVIRKSKRLQNVLTLPLSN
jgi:hypothetical protein